MATYYVDGAVGNDGNAGTSQGSGNAWATIAHALSTISNGDIVYVKASATYSIGTGLTLATSAYTAPSQVIGYTSSPGDNGQATIQASANITGLTISGDGGSFQNFVIDANGHTGTGVVLSSTFGATLRNCWVKGWTTYGVNQTGSGVVFNLIGTRVSGCSGTAAVNGAISLLGCSIVGNTTIGYLGSSPANCVLLNNLIANNSGGSSDGIQVGYGAYLIAENSIYNNGRDGLRTSFEIMGPIFNNIFSQNAGYGINWSVAYGSPFVDYNAFYSNTSGARNNLTASPNDVTLSGDPFTNAAGGDFTLNNTAGAGAACRSAGFPGALLYGGTGYLDIGALRHQDPAGGGVIIIDDD